MENAHYCNGATDRFLIDFSSTRNDMMRDGCWVPGLTYAGMSVFIRRSLAVDVCSDTLLTCDYVVRPLTADRACC